LPKAVRTHDELPSLTEIEGEAQGCQILLGTTYQNGEKYTK
jgi:hypothetical protein